MFLFFWYHRSHLTLMYTQILDTVKLSGFNYSGLSEMLTHGRVGRLGAHVASSSRAPDGDECPRDHVCGLPEAGSGSLSAPPWVPGAWMVVATPSIRCGTLRSLGRCTRCLVSLPSSRGQGWSSRLGGGPQEVGCEEAPGGSCSTMSRDM